MRGISATILLILGNARKRYNRPLVADTAVFRIIGRLDFGPYRPPTLGCPGRTAGYGPWKGGCSGRWGREGCLL